jgi:hypothetical protein
VPVAALRGRGEIRDDHREADWNQEKAPMNPSEEFLRHAEDCQKMAKFTRDPTSRATWTQMAERWMHCAEVFKSQSLAAQSIPAKRLRKSDSTHH